MTIGAPYNKLERCAIAWPEVDIFIAGHDHRRGALPLTALYMTRNRKPTLRDKTRWLVKSGSYLRAYLEGSKYHGRPKGGYIEKRALPPATLGSPKIWIRPYYRGKSSELDITVES